MLNNTGSAPRDTRGLNITAIIVSYKSAALTVECLKSLSLERERSLPGLRCVVIDNASGDHPTIAAAMEACQWTDWIRLIEAPRNGGFAYGNNLALREIAPFEDVDYVFLINPDARAHPGSIAALANFLQATPAAGIAGGAFENADGSDWPFAFNFPTLLSELEGGLQLGVVTRLLHRHRVPIRMDHEARRVDWISGAAMMIRRDVFERIGGFDEGFFLYFEETEFCFRAKRAGFEVWWIPQSRVTHIGGQSTDIGSHHSRPKRLPAYWYESRRRYFHVTHGLTYAMATDSVALAAGVFGLLKRICTSRFSHGVPRWLRDLYAHSLLRRRNRKVTLDQHVPRLGRGA
jgi:N-acetylglucosaminyl-diphospho-decaprenol L-rhamnosyltransferase